MERGKILSSHNDEQGSIAIVGNQPEALLMAVLFSEAKTPTYLVGSFEGSNQRNPNSAWDEARYLLTIHQKNGTIRQVHDIRDLPLSKIEDIIVTGHATNQQETGELERTVKAIAKTLPKNTNFTLTGLCKPGYTRETVGEIIRKYSGHSIGGEVGLCYLPILWNGEPFQVLREKPIIMGGIAEKAASHVQDLFLRIFPAMAATSKINAAEAAGLFTPLYREVIAALELELANFCEGERVDYADAIDLCKASGLQSLGIPRMTPARDALATTIALSVSSARSSRVIRTARRVNEQAQTQIIAMIKNALARCGRRLRHSKIAVLGLNGLRTASEVKPRPPQIFHTLKSRGAILSLYPGEVPPWTLKGYDESTTVEKSISKAIQRANCALIALEPPVVAELNPQRLASEMSHPAAVCDLTRAMEASNVERAGLFYTSIGRGSPEA